MNYIFFDLETSGSSTSHDSILEAFFMLTNDSFQELDRLSLRCRLKEGVIPNLNAVLINRSTVNLLKNSNMSWYQLVNAIEAKLRQWSPAYIWGYGSVNFDFEFLIPSGQKLEIIKHCILTCQRRKMITVCFFSCLVSY